MVTTARTVQDVTIPLSGTTTGDINLVGARSIGIVAPGLTSCQLFLQGNIDAADQEFRRVWTADGNFEWTWDIGAGSGAVVVEDILWPFAQARIESGVPQAAVRSLAIITSR